VSAQSQTEPNSAGTANTDDDIVYLSPFEVSSEGSSGYMVTDTLAGTRIRTDLKDIGSAISVYNKQFMRDIGATDNSRLLVYATSAEVGGAGGNFQGGGNSGQVPNEGENLYHPNSNTRVRGLAAADNCRDFMMTDIPWDSYNTSRIDIQRGANAILFGNGSPAGIINGTIDGAQVGGNSGTIEAKIGSYGTIRGSVNANISILDDELAVRVAGLYDDTKYRQDPAFQRNERQFVALRYDPKWMRFEGARTTIKASYEHGDIDSNRPRTLTPIDCITPWFKSVADGGLGKRTYQTEYTDISDENVIAENASNYSYGARRSGSLNYEPYIGGISDGPVGAVDTDGSVTYYMLSQHPVHALSSAGAVDGSISGMTGRSLSTIATYNTYASNAGMPLAVFGAYKAKGLTDASIYDFYNKLLDGDTKKEWANFDAARFSFEQTFFNDKAGFEVVYDDQHWDDGHTEVLNAAATLTVDINATLPDGSPNPNVGRPCVYTNSQSSYSSDRDRKTFRATAFFELDANDFMDADSWMARIIGHHRFTGMYQDYKYDFDGRQWIRYTTDGINDYLSLTPMEINKSTRYLSECYYLGDSLASRDSASGANISNINSAQSKAIGTSGNINLFDSTWASTADPGSPYVNPISRSAAEQFQSENPANYKGWSNVAMKILNADKGDKDSLYTGASDSSTHTKSWVAVWQGFMLDNCLIPMVGYRWDSDTEKSGTYGHYSNADGGSIDFNNYTKDPDNTVDWEGLTWSMVAHVPEKWTRMLPGRPTFGVFFGQSKNFQPMTRLDLYGEPISPPSGKTKEYGFIITALDDRISLRVGHYKTNVANSNVGSGWDTSWYFSNMWGWESRDAANAYDYYFNGQGTWRYTPKTAAENGGVAQTQEEADAEAIAAINAFYNNLPSEAIARSFGLDLAKLKDHKETTYSYRANWITGDTESEGWETELNLRLTDSWNLSLNVIKTDASQVNMAKSVEQFLEDKWALLNGPLGDLRIWSPGYAASNTAKAWFQSTLWSGYQLYKLTEGTSVAELRKWRFNVVTSYDFKDGMLKGTTIGGGYRWMDKQIIGYPAVVSADGASANYDIDHPFMGPTEDSVDIWIGYSHQLNDKVNWRIQLNINNVLASRDLIPVASNPDGSVATWRIPEARTWSISNTFTF
jgi:hypothetical protein